MYCVFNNCLIKNFVFIILPLSFCSESFEKPSQLEKPSQVVFPLTPPAPRRNTYMYPGNSIKQSNTIEDFKVDTLLRPVTKYVLVHVLCSIANLCWYNM